MRLQSCRRTLSLDADGRGCFFTPCQVAGLNVPVHQTLNFCMSSMGRLCSRLMNSRSACRNARMSTKTIAVEASVYERLANAKRPSESFTKVIDRLLAESRRGICAQAVSDAAELWDGDPRAERDAGEIERIVEAGRMNTDWEVERLIPSL